MSKIYDIRLCRVDELDLLKHFIHVHWKTNHILALSKTLIDFQHIEAEKNIYNFVIAVNILTGEIDGLIGFIPISHYDKALVGEKDCWGAIWKIREDVENEDIKTLGLYLFEMFNDIVSYNTFAAIGISRIAKKLYKALRYKTGILNQFYIVNENYHDFRIAQIHDAIFKRITIPDPNIEIRIINNLSNTETLKCSYSPQKSIIYLINRYQNHPIYNYKFLGIYKNNDLQTILVVRIITINNSRIIRIVDLLGSYYLPDIYNQMQSILMLENAEYIDFVNFGIADEIFYDAGFVKLNTEGKTIVPMYFEPFERRNVAIEFAYKSADAYMIFKGDSDQDRPNIL